MAGENAVLDFEDSEFLLVPENGSINSSVCGC